MCRARCTSGTCASAERVRCSPRQGVRGSAHGQRSSLFCGWAVMFVHVHACHVHACPCPWHHVSCMSCHATSCYVMLGSVTHETSKWPCGTWSRRSHCTTGCHGARSASAPGERHGRKSKNGSSRYASVRAHAVRRAAQSERKRRRRSTRAQSSMNTWKAVHEHTHMASRARSEQEGEPRKRRAHEQRGWYGCGRRTDYTSVGARA
jgi:hypothetical protein